MKKRLILLLLFVSIVTVGGCGTQPTLLGTEGAYLLTTMDALTVPNRQVPLRARFQAGDFLRSQPGYVLRFYQNDTLFKVAQTDENGIAEVSFIPPHPGDYRFQVKVAPAGLPDQPPPPQELLITCRNPDTPIAVVDLDKTVVATGFDTVLVGTPDPMPNSQQVLQRLSQTYTIVYLTHRPDYFGPKSKGWLWEHNYPKGPVLLSSLSGFLKGSAAYKTQMLHDLKQQFHHIELGIGDKVSDAIAYHDNQLRSFLIIQIPQTDNPQSFDDLATSLEELPPAVQVVTHWDQIENAIFQNADFPPVFTIHQLKQMAVERQPAPDKPQDTSDQTENP